VAKWESPALEVETRNGAAAWGTDSPLPTLQEVRSQDNFTATSDLDEAWSEAI
jgi:hypothetical protein